MARIIHAIGPVATTLSASHLMLTPKSLQSPKFSAGYIMNASVTWTKRWTFILAATGAAVGLGNIWKFPYITGENGGGAFVLVYLLCILALGIPIMMAETLLGRAGRANPIVAVRRLARNDGKSGWWSLVGAMGVLAGLMIIMYYSVVGGWALDYVMQSIQGTYFQADGLIAKANFGDLASDNNRQLIWHSLFLLLTAIVVGAGVTRGIGAAAEILMPLLIVILVALVFYSASVGDLHGAVHFMFHADFSKLTGDSVIIAMGHAFFTLSIGMGSIMVYGSYMPDNSCIGRNVLLIAGLDTAIALIAGLAIFPLVIANGLEPASGPGLMFESLPIAFGNMPAGVVVGAAFFFLVAIAALSSAFSLIEPGVAWLEQLGLNRMIATTIIALIAWLGGLASIYSSEVFNTLDYLTANIMLPIGGLIMAIFCGWVLRRVTVRKQLNSISMGWFNAWYITIRFIAPAGVIVVFLSSLQLI